MHASRLLDRLVREFVTYTENDQTHSQFAHVAVVEYSLSADKEGAPAYS